MRRTTARPPLPPGMSIGNTPANIYRLYVPTPMPLHNAAHLRDTPPMYWRRQVGPFPDVDLPAFERGVSFQTRLLLMVRRMREAEKRERQFRASAHTWLCGRKPAPV